MKTVISSKLKSKPQSDFARERVRRRAWLEAYKDVPLAVYTNGMTNEQTLYRYGREKKHPFEGRIFTKNEVLRQERLKREREKAHKDEIKAVGDELKEINEIAKLAKEEWRRKRNDPNEAALRRGGLSIDEEYKKGYAERRKRRKELKEKAKELEEKYNEEEPVRELIDKVQSLDVGSYPKWYKNDVVEELVALNPSVAEYLPDDVLNNFYGRKWAEEEQERRLKREQEAERIREEESMAEAGHYNSSFIESLGVEGRKLPTPKSITAAREYGNESALKAFSKGDIKKIEAFYNRCNFGNKRKFFRKFGLSENFKHVVPRDEGTLDELYKDGWRVESDEILDMYLGALEGVEPPRNTSYHAVEVGNQYRGGDSWYDAKYNDRQYKADYDPMYSLSQGNRFRKVKRELPVDKGAKPELLDIKGTDDECFQRAKKKFKKFPEYAKAADGAKIMVKTKQGGSEEERIKHIISDNRTGKISSSKFAWLPNIVETLKNAQVRLKGVRDARSRKIESNRIYVRRYDNNSLHAVVVSPEGEVVGQDLKRGFFITQYPVESKTGMIYASKVEWVNPKINRASTKKVEAPNRLNRNRYSPLPKAEAGPQRTQTILDSRPLSMIEESHKDFESQEKFQKK